MKIREYEWQKELDERQSKEIAFARAYAREFGHGTDGHHRLLIIAKLAKMLDDAEDSARDAKEDQSWNDE